MSTSDLWPPNASALPLRHALEHVYAYMLYTVRAHTHNGTLNRLGDGSVRSKLAMQA